MGRNLTNLHISESFQYLTQISGSELTDGLGVDIDSLNITASTATSASHAVIADSALTATSASLATTASLVSTADGSSESGIHYLPFVDVRASDGQQLFTDTELQYNPATDTIEANLTGTASFADTATSASFATTASYAISSSADDLTLQQVTDNGATTTNDISIDGRIYGVAGISSPTAAGNYIVRGGTVDAGLQLQGNDTTSTNSIKLDNTNGVQISGSLGIQDDITIAGDLTGLASNVNVNSITASFASFTSASIGSLRTVTGSAVIIGDEFIILNADTPTARYAGIKVYDSGSGTPVTASLEWDGLSDNWVLVEESGNSGVLLTGPTGSKGSEVLPTVNTLQKGGGHHTLINSSISDDGTLVTIDANVSASGYVSASTFIGDGSGLTGVGAFPFTGSAEITGSLDVIGPITTGDGNSTATGLNSAVIGGSGNAVSNTDSVIIGGNNNTATGTYAGVILGNGQQANALRCVAIGGEGNRLTGGQASVIAGGFNNQSTFVQGFIGGGSGNNGSGVRGAVLGGLTNTVAGEDNGALAGRSNTIPSGEYNVAVGGRGNTTGTNAFYSVLVGGNNNSIAGFDRSVVLGGLALSSTKDDEVVVPDLTINGTVSGSAGVVNFESDVQITGSVTAGDALNVNSGTDAMLLSIDSNTTGDRSGVFAGYQNTASETDSVVVGGFNNAAGGLRSIVAGGTNNTVTSIYGGAFGGNGNTITHNNSVILGGSSLSTSKTNEAVVNHLTTNGTVVQDVKALSIVANAAELDASTGNMFTLTLQNGVDTELQLSNQTAGQTFSVQITNNATGAGTISFDSQFLFEGGTAFTATAATSAVDVLTFTCFAGGDVVCVSAKNFS
jgi:hypothetical protein